MEVGTWSQKNFGTQTSKALTIASLAPLGLGSPDDTPQTALHRIGDDLPPGTIRETPYLLGSLAPLLGMVEEVGEWFLAETNAEQKDALADVGIYLCDYASREGFILPEPILAEVPIVADPLASLIMVLGNLCHVTLKHHQGIRGFDDRGHYKIKRSLACQLIVNNLAEYAEQDFATPFITILDEVWTDVRHRNWKKNPQGDGV